MVVRPGDELIGGGRLVAGVEVISEERAIELCRSDAGFLTGPSGALSESQAVARLRKQVNVRLFERFRVAVKDPEIGTAIGLLQSGESQPDPAGL